ncbi:hypothetical protein GCM10011611_52820 [Aliidongia dinghuensis]|uniref:ABC-type transport auxiliary lipoprotein component domain-containing protein n=1 Tax=Aliidongia dinghuensis TaxID=1867774 RepID=A0A8J3E614_9PROT|nr:hypothetical protein [Aliidongia dinghuensis]GGF39856.1 hypothetical protein GCM10011611_52820 [Aliidongia dinghuensis]
MPIRLRQLLAVALVATAASCSSDAPPPPRFADIHFLALPPFKLNVSQIQVDSRFQPTFKEPNVEHEFPVPPQRALENWAHDRLLAVGGPTTGYVARFTIVDASVRESELPKKEGLTAVFTTQQAERYDGHVSVLLQIINPQGVAERTASAEAAVSRSVPEGITLNERDKVWYDMTRDLMADLDRQLQKQVDSAFPPFRL